MMPGIGAALLDHFRRSAPAVRNPVVDSDVPRNSGRFVRALRVCVPARAAPPLMWSSRGGHARKPPEFIEARDPWNIRPGHELGPAAAQTTLGGRRGAGSEVLKCPTMS